MLVVVCILEIGTGSYLLDCGYNYCVRESFSRHANDDRFFDTMVIYTVEREDGENIKEDETRRLFDRIYDICDDGGYLMHSAGKGWYDRLSHFSDYYDCIQIDTLWTTIEQYVRENHQGNDAYLEKLVDKYNEETITALLPKVLPRLLRVFADSVLTGLVTTVAKKHRLWYATVYWHICFI